MDDQNHSLAEAIRSGRRAALLTQEQLAEQAGVSVRCIRALEAGRVTEPRFATIRLLLDALGPHAGALAEAHSPTG